MSLGVPASKSVHVMVETTSGVGGSDCDVALDRFQSVWAAAWVAGRLTVTALQVHFTPDRASRGVATVDVPLREIVEVESTGNRLSGTLTLRTATHRVQVRGLGATALAADLATLVEDAKRVPQRRR